MHKIVIEEPYQFIPPYRGRFWGEIFRPILPYYLNWAHGIVGVECRGLDKLKRSVDDGYGILLAPNHCRLSDPMTMGWIVRESGIHLYSMASWHLFKQDRFFDRLSAWMMRRLGAFSILREGTDRTALTTAIEILATAERPLVVFPEGVVSRTNDRLGPLMDGITFMARMAAKKSEKAGRPGVLIHPVALRYVFLDDVEPAIEPFVEGVEQRFTWEPDRGTALKCRVERICESLLCLRELRHLGNACEGDFEERRISLINAILEPIEAEWLSHVHDGETPINRVKEIRTALLQKLLDDHVPDEEKVRIRRQLDDAYVAQQLHFHSSGYLAPDSPPEHLLETIERIEEDLTDVTSNHGRLKVIMEIGDPIHVSTERDKRRETDPLLEEISTQLASMLERTGEEISLSRHYDTHAVVTRSEESVSGV